MIANILFFIAAVCVIIIVVVLLITWANHVRADDTESDLDLCIRGYQAYCDKLDIEKLCILVTDNITGCKIE